jgi:O-antigen/teichoic acid export membrane protein
VLLKGHQISAYSQVYLCVHGDTLSAEGGVILSGAKGSFVRRTIETAGSFGVTLVLNLFTGILISRGLGPHDKGIYTAITTWAAILLWIFNVSLYQVTVYYFGRFPSERRTVFTTLMVASFFLGLLACCVGEFAVVPLLSSHGFSSSIGLVRLLFITLPLSTMFQVVSGGLNGSMRFTFTNAVRVLQPLTLVVIWAWLQVSHRMDIASSLGWYTGVITFFNILGLLYAVKAKLFGLVFSWSILKSGLSYGLKAHGSTTADVVSGNLTSVILSIMLPAVYLGYYSTAQSAAGTLNVVSMAVAMTGFPLLSSLDESQIHSMTMRMWRATLFVTAPAAIVMAGLFPWVIPFVFGKSFQESVTCAITLLVSVVLSGQAGILRNALNGRGYALINSTSEGIALIFSLGGMLILPRLFEVEGAALAAVIGSIVRVVVLLRSYVVHIHPIRALELLPSRSEVHFCVTAIAALRDRIIQRA